MRRRSDSRRGVVWLAVVGLAAGVLGHPITADALANRKQVLIGGNQGSGTEILWTAPGLGNAYQDPSEIPAQVPMPHGRFSQLRVASVNDGTATSGTVTVTVTVNGQDTALACSVVTGAHCESPSGTRIAIDDGAFVAVKVTSTLNQGVYWFTYSLLFN